MTPTQISLAAISVSLVSGFVAKNVDRVEGMSPLFATLTAQSTAQRPQFKGTVTTVEVDVIVTDRQQQTVRDLGVTDFALREDGKPQTITNFAFVDLPTNNPGYEVAPKDGNATPTRGRVDVPPVLSSTLI